MSEDLLGTDDESFPSENSSNNQEKKPATGLSENKFTTRIIEEKEEKHIEIDCLNEIQSVAFIIDGEQIVSGGHDEKIRRWQVQDGMAVGRPINAGGSVCNIAVSRDGKWAASGTTLGRVTLWNAEKHERVSAFSKRSHKEVSMVDLSPDATTIAFGSRGEKFALVRSLSATSDSQQLLHHFKHDSHVATVKFSPDGLLIATATLRHESVRIYDFQDGHLLVDFPIRVDSYNNQSLVWANDSKQIFALSADGNIHCLDVCTQTELSKWPIHSDNKPGCISIASNGSFIATSAYSSVSFWDTTTHKQIGSIIHHPARVRSMTVSANYDLVMGGGTKITLWNLHDIFPEPYRTNIFEIRRTRTETHLKETVKSLRVQHELSNEKIVDLEKTVQQLRTQLSMFQQKSESLHKILCAHQQKHQCETMFANGHVTDAAHLLLEIVRTASDDVTSDTLIIDWLSDFSNKCISAMERIGDEASNIDKHGDALTAYSVALSLGPSIPTPLLSKWAGAMLLCGSINQASDVAAKLNLPRFSIYRAICEALERDCRITQAIRFFRQMKSELTVDASIQDERAQWEFSFQRRCTQTLEKLADVAMGCQNYNEAAEHLSTILSLDPKDRLDTLIKRSKARMMMNSWENAIKDADEVIGLDPSSYLGYEQRHATLHAAKRYTEAVEAFDTMLLKLEQSSDEHVHQLRGRYVDPRPTIRHIINTAVADIPRVLIDTTTGRLHDRTQLAQVFEKLPILKELVSSMTTEVDDARIWREVNAFYQYVMFSHKWEHDEPLLQDVEHISVYELGASPENVKLQTFCSLVNSLGFRWAWSDTCCVDKVNNVVLQESLVAMFTWYRGSALTVVYLLGVPSLSKKPGGLRGSIWNTRAWTYQEYVAADRVRFYTEDWKPYLDLTLSNHKESPVVISEMEQVSRVSPEQLAVLQPGLDRVREKLFLASMRRTSLVEDIAYSLLGIFNVAIPVIYGEGNRAVGRLLEHILTGSGDVTVLAWTGTVNRYNSCLPTELTVYKDLVPPHIPQLMETSKVDQIVAELHSSIPELSPATKLYDRLNDIPPPFLASSRLRLPGIVSLATEVVRISGPDPKTKLCLYRATTTIFGGAEIKTTNDLTSMNALYLVHPWIRPLLDQEFSCASARLDKTTRALRLIARLRQPFGALLFEQMSRVEYKRVAADSLIMVQICKDVSLHKLIDNIHTIDVQ